MYWTGLIHVAFAFTALISGFFVFFNKKGTRRHKKIGWVYGASMLGLNVTALSIYRLFGTFGPFHVLAVVSLVTIVLGLLHVILRRPKKNWYEHHAYWMSWSYVGLAAAAAAEVTSRVPDSPFWWMVVGGSLVVVALGQRLINTKVPGIVEPFRRMKR